MYERFTDRSRKVMQLANEQAQRFSHDYIGTEHILLGIAKTEESTAAKVLANLRVIPHQLAREVEKIVQRGPIDERGVTGHLPHTPRAKKVIEYSIEEARNLNHDYVGTEHLLLGLICEAQGAAWQVLAGLGLTLDAVREEVLKVVGRGEIHAVPKSLNPAKTEGFALLPEDDEETPAAPVNVPGVERAVAFLRQQKEAAVLAMTFEDAARLREMEVAVSGLLAWFRGAKGGP